MFRYINDKPEIRNINDKSEQKLSEKNDICRFFWEAQKKLS